MDSPFIRAPVSTSPVLESRRQFRYIQPAADRQRRVRIQFRLPPAPSAGSEKATPHEKPRLYPLTRSCRLSYSRSLQTPPNPVQQLFGWHVQLLHELQFEKLVRYLAGSLPGQLTASTRKKSCDQPTREPL